MLKKHKNPKGGLTEAGRKFFKRKEGSNLKPGVKGAANTRKDAKKRIILESVLQASDLPHLKNQTENRLGLLAARAWESLLQPMLKQLES